MPEYCTCGTKLIEDARFCHRCGRPTRELVEEAVAPEETPPPIPVAPQPSLQAKLSQLPVSFSNPIALRVAFLMSLAIIPVELTPVLNALLIVWWLGAGWCAVLLYRRLTGSVLSIGAGARLGSITGVLTFLSLAIGFTATVVLTGKQFFDELSQMMKQNPDAAKLVDDPASMFALLLFSLVIGAALVVGTCAAGGALGARFTARKVSG